MIELLTFVGRLVPGDRVRFQGVKGRHEVESVLLLGSNRAMFVRIDVAGGNRIDCGYREFVWSEPRGVR